MNSMKLWCNDENKEQKKKYYVKLKKYLLPTNSTSLMLYPNMIIPFNLVFITIHVMSSKNLINSFNLSIAKNKTHT